MEIQVVKTRPISPADQALYDAGKQMLADSVSVGREFCKFMVGVSTGAIPLYLALLALAFVAERVVRGALHDARRRAVSVS